MTFTGLTAAEIEAALDGKDVFLIPELENGQLAGALSEAALDVIRDFVSNGGKLIIHGSRSGEIDNGEAAEFLNELFGYSLGEVRSDSTDSARTSSAAGTFLADGPDGLSGTNAGHFLTDLPDNGTSIYESDDVFVGEGGEGSEDTITGSSVALFEEGTGHVLYLGYDWFDAIPGPGTQDGGWVELLEIAVRMEMGANDDFMLGDGILNASLGGKGQKPSDNVQVSGGEGGFKKGGKTILAGGDDEMYGGLGDDKMVGDAILNAHAGGLLALSHDGHGDGWSHHDFWFDKEILFGDLTRKDKKHKHGKGKPGDWDDNGKGGDAKLFGGDDFMFGGARAMTGCAATDSGRSPTTSVATSVAT